MTNDSSPFRLSRSQVREIDRLSTERYHIPSIVLMENAARAVVEVVESMNPPGEIAILCGGGNNGGDGLAIARHLHNKGRRVTIVFGADPSSLKGDALIQWQIVQAMKLRTFFPDPAGNLAGLSVLRAATLMIDALLGTGLTAAPREPARMLIEACNDVPIAQRPVVAVDLPSGLDCDTGRPLGSCIRATQTVTFVAEKKGFANPEALPYLGRVTVGDIGCPRELIKEIAAGAGD